MSSNDPAFCQGNCSHQIFLLHRARQLVMYDGYQNNGGFKLQHTNLYSRDGPELIKAIV